VCVQVITPFLSLTPSPPSPIMLCTISIDVKLQQGEEVATAEIWEIVQYVKMVSVCISFENNKVK
jgi:hypothetical protein